MFLSSKWSYGRGASEVLPLEKQGDDYMVRPSLIKKLKSHNTTMRLHEFLTGSAKEVIYKDSDMSYTFFSIRFIFWYFCVC